MALKYRVNRYNWLGQKLLANHDFSSIIWLKQNMSLPENGPSELRQDYTKRPVSDHLNYVHSLALLKTGTRMEAIIDTIQQLNFYQNSQYFLLLCHCLAYLGRHDSVVALCRQVIGHELDQQQVSAEDNSVNELSLNEGQLHVISDQTGVERQKEARKPVAIPLVQQKSFDNSKIFAQITSSQLIDNPRLWVIFGVSLEYQHQLKDAQTAFRVASMLASRHVVKQKENSEEPLQALGLNNYFLPAIKYSEICARYKSHIKQAMLALFPSEQVWPRNLTITHVLAFYLYKQVASSKSGVHRALELVTNLDSYLSSTKNPAQAYNQISLSCRQKFYNQSAKFENWQTSIANHKSDITDLDFVLAKSFVLINDLLQVSGKTELSETDFEKLMTKRIDQCIDSMLTSNSIGWNMPALWNNLGICHLIKRRNIASISCLSKALSLNPLNWRINFNLALACIQVGLSCKASVHLMAARNLYKEQSSLKIAENCIEPLITTLQAICYEKLDEHLEARRLYIEATQLPFKTISDAPVLSTVNYLIFLYNHSNIKPDNNSDKVQLNLLDKLEQYWLQRDKNSHQFNMAVLKAASNIGNQVNSQGKVYAWMKPHKTSQDVID